MVVNQDERRVSSRCRRRRRRGVVVGGVARGDVVDCRRRGWARREEGRASRRRDNSSGDRRNLGVDGDHRASIATTIRRTLDLVYVDRSREGKAAQDRLTGNGGGRWRGGIAGGGEVTAIRSVKALNASRAAVALLFFLLALIATLPVCDSHPSRFAAAILFIVCSSCRQGGWAALS